MPEFRDLLIEIGTEELPPKALFDLALAFEKGIREGLAKAGFPNDAIRRYATARRLAVLIDRLPVRQPDRQLEPVSYTHLDVYKRQVQEHGKH